MKATGIVRRIDDLGRIVVPKEIRRTLRIREGDPLEIFTDREGEIILKKYSPIGELSQFAGEYAESLAHTTGYLVLITDGDHVVAASGSGKRDFEGKPISGQLEEIIGVWMHLHTPSTQVLLYNFHQKAMGTAQSRLHHHQHRTVHVTMNLAR